MEIEKLILLFARLSDRVSRHKCCSVSSNDVEDALFILLSDEYKFSWRGSLWDIEISEEEAFRRLVAFDFDTLRYTLDTSPEILPAAIRIHFKVRVKAKGLIWVIHKYDADPFPSNPHAHQLENNIKLDLSNGKCYQKRKLCYTITRKELIEIREKASKVFLGQLPELSI